MKHVICMISILMIFSLAVQAEKGEEESIYEEALAEYREDNFGESMALFEKLIAAGCSSFELYYNAGNAAFKTGDIPTAILNYEKALLFKPFNDDALHNLEMARSYTADKLEAIPEIFFVSWFKKVSLLLNTNQWALISLLSFTLFLVLLAVFLFSARYKTKKYSFSAAMIIFIISLLSFMLALTNKSLTWNNKESIVMEPQVTGRSSPGTGGRELFVIHEGTKVKVEDQLGEWYEVKLPDGTVGWIPMDFIEKITP
ncbi:MAG: tetratricopeptide repeat protein [Bacteroidales bacterium]